MKRLLIALLVTFALSIELTATCKVTKITQAMIPYPITHSGRYEVCEELFFDGINPTAADAAITVAADNVQIFLNNHSITLTNNAIGIQGDGYSELLIANDAISNVNAGNIGFAISLKNYSKVILRNIMTTDNNVGLLLQNCNNVTVDSCSFLASDTPHAGSIGAQVAASSAVTFDKCLFNLTGEGSFGLQLLEDSNGQRCSDCKIISCSFENAGGNNLLVSGNDGLLVKNSSFSRQIDDQSIVGLQKATSSRFEGCTFISQSQFTNMLRFINGCSGLIIDSCLFDGQPSALTTATLLNLEAGTKDIYVTGSTFNGNANINGAGITANGDNILIEHSLVQGITDIDASGILTSGTGCTISSCTINNNFRGITIQGSSTQVLDSQISNSTGFGVLLTSDFNVIARNTITQNTNSAVLLNVSGSSNSIIDNTVSGGSGGGINIGATALHNTLQYNTVHSNSSVGISDNSVSMGITTNQIYYNTSYNNGGGLLNYAVAPFPVTVVQPQGACTLETANIDGGLGTATPVSCP